MFNLKRGYSLKKIINFSILMTMIFLYLVGILKLKKHNIDMFIIIRFFGDIIRLILGICGIILTYNNMRTKINNKANFMAISTLTISAFVVLQLLSYMGKSDYYILIGMYDKCIWAIEFLQIMSLIICIHLIDEHINFKWWMVTYFIVCGIGIICVCLPYPIEFNLFKHNKLLMLKEMNSMICILSTSLAYGFSYKKIKSLSSFEEKIMSTLFLIKIGVNVLRFFSGGTYHLNIHLIIEIVQIIFSLLTIAYIDELTLGITWKKIDLGLQSKSEEATRGYVEKRTLVIAANEIQRSVDSINRKILSFEVKIVSDYGGKYMKYIDKIKNNCHRLLKLSMNILDLNTYEGGKRAAQFEQTNLTELIGGVVESLETYIMQRGIKIVYTASSEFVMAEVDKEAIERLFLNLLSNAVKYNKFNGTIRVILTEKKKKIYLCIQDTGIGIPSHYLDLIFEKFQRVNTGLVNEQEGSGLGLSIVKSLVELHHGEIRIVSQEGKGTLISIGLPSIQEQKVDIKKCRKGYRSSLRDQIKVEFSDLDKC